MEQIIKEIQKVFISCESFEFKIDIENKKLIDFDFQRIDFSFYNQTEEFKRNLQLIFLAGNDLTLLRVKSELLKIEINLEKMDFGLNLKINESDFQVIIEPDAVVKINEVKLNYVKQLISFIDTLISPHQAETKTDKLKADLAKYGFFELSKVKQLSEPKKERLIELISTKGLPYSIAMFEFLDFLNHIEREHFSTKYELNREVAKWFNSDKDGRAVKGNISSLSNYSTENKSKYTAHTHKETVKRDYQKLK